MTPEGILSTPTSAAFTIQRLHLLDDPADLSALCEVLIDCVEGGASVSFMHPLSTTKAEAFWRDVAHDASLGKRALLVTRDKTGLIVATVQVVLSQPENQPHRADISKLLVHRSARRHGLGALLMQAAEQAASHAGKSLLVLDTATGGGAQALYEKLGWQLCGQIPDYASWPDGGLCGTTIYYKAI
jgi:ribosomal protein S18 acetylase RimI-like enzyme